MADLAITCEGVWKSYRVYRQRAHTLKERVVYRRQLHHEDFWALKGVDLEIEHGSTVGIIGANGSGKSTLLKTIAKILTPDKGSVRLNGTVSPLLELGTGFHPELTGRENVYLGSALLGQTKKEVRARYDSIVDFAGIEEFMDLPLKNYSSGMYARLAFALASSVDPDILIVDEVLSVGDEAFQLRCYERIADLRSQGRTIVVVSHSLATIKGMCSHAWWLDHGVVRESGKAADVVSGYLSAVHGGPEQEHDGESGRRYGSGQAKLLDVRFLDGNGTPAAIFRTGDPMRIRLTYNSSVADLVCALSVFRGETLAYVFGQSTVRAGLDLQASGEGVLEFRVKELPLLEGPYIVSFALHDKSGRHVYDCLDRRHRFHVLEGKNRTIESGLVHVPSEWVSRSSAPASAAGSGADECA